MPRRLVINVLLLFLLGPLTYSCMGQSAATQPIYYYTLAYEPQLTPHTATLPWVLRVHRFSVSPVFNTQRMIYADKGLHRNSYGYHQWIAPPGQLLPFLLVRDLRQTNGYQAVLTPDASMPATHHIHGWLEQFLEEDASDPPQAHVRIHITLVSAHETDPSKRVMLQKSYQAQTPCLDATPGALALAMSKAVAQINQTVVQDIYKRLIPNG